MKRPTKSCDFCGEYYESETVESRNGFYMWIESDPDKNELRFMAQANDEEGYALEGVLTVEMSFCPMCGRDMRRARC